jgi:hypothetical protein
MISKLFHLLDNWRNLPSYQLERRADIFFALYLDKIIKSDIVIQNYNSCLANDTSNYKFSSEELKSEFQIFMS